MRQLSWICFFSATATFTFALAAPGCSGNATSSSASSSSGGTAGGGGGGTSSGMTTTSSSSSTTSSSSSTSGGGMGGAGGMGGMDGGMGAGGNCPPLPTTPLVPLTRTQVAQLNTAVVYVTGAPGDTTRLYALEQNTGVIRIIKDGNVISTPFLDIGACGTEFTCNGERGLLGLAFHPNYQQNGRFWINYTDQNGDTSIAEYKRSMADPDVADPVMVKELINIAQPAGNHNGGALAFGPDGYLYIGMGDGGGANDQFGNGQNLSSMLAKMLRVDVDAYPTPVPGNLPAAMGNPHIWGIGLRNPWRYSFDRCTGDLYIGDVGQGQLEEIDVQPAGQGLLNYGWNIMEGTNCFSPPNNCNMAGLTLPVAEYNHNEGCSVTGGYVYRGTKIPSLVGRYIYGDYCTHKVWSFVWDGVGATDPIDLTSELDPFGNISSFGEDAEGELYIVTLSNGRIFRIEAQ